MKEDENERKLGRGGFYKSLSCYNKHISLLQFKNYKDILKIIRVGVF